jgi:TolA-binding protein
MINTAPIFRNKFLSVLTLFKGIKFALIVLVLNQIVAGLVLAQTNNAFTINVNNEPKTIGDIKPAFIVYKDKPLPQVSINYVLKRYIKLFETSESPSVKIDALNRINNLRAKYELDSKKLTIDPLKQSQVVLDSYDKIIDTGEFYQRMDELIYQTAKATQFVGNTEESIKRLKLLVGLYPRSLLVDESMFRMAEGYFELGKYDDAAAQYKKILAFSQTNYFHLQSKYKLAWSEFRLDRLDEAGKQAIDVLDAFPSLKKALNFESVVAEKQDLVEDDLRLLSIIASKQDGTKTLELLQEQVGHKYYAYLLYDSLFRFYLIQDRFQDAARVAHSYTKSYISDFHAYTMALNEIKSYKTGKFEIQEWKAKEHLVSQFGLHTDYWKSLTPEQQQVVRPILIENLVELSHLYYVRMQTAFEQQNLLTTSSEPTGLENIQTLSASYHSYAKQAAEYYLALVETRGDSRMNGGSLYLAAEALFKAGDFQRSIDVYERAAYEQPGHADAVNAGYAAILTYNDLAKSYRPKMDAVTADLHKKLRRESIKRFAKYFPGAKQTPPLLNGLANELFAEKEYLLAEEVSREVLSKSLASAEILYGSGLINAHSNFELGQYKQAESVYERLLSYNKEKDKPVLSERLAASIYKQAEQEPVIGLSAELYLKVVDKVPDASIVPQALYDASSQFLQAKKWQQAIAALSVFQQRFPKHSLYNDASDKLVFAYLENQEPISAAEKLVEISKVSTDKEKASNSLYKAAEIYQENEFQNLAMPLLASFIELYPSKFDLAIEAHDAHISFYNAQKNTPLKVQWQQKLVKFEKSNSKQRTARSASLAANAAFELTYLDLEKFESINLSLPLKKSLEKKKKALKNIVSQLESLSEYQDSVIMSAATYQIASVYRTLARDILASERPSALSELQLEQYNILLEEQAYPFEEQAMDIYMINIEKVSQGHYDKWIEQTFEVMAKMNPTEFKRDLKVTPYAETMF